MKKHDLPKHMFMKGEQYIFQIQVPKSLQHYYDKKQIKIYLGRDFSSAKMQVGLYRAHYLAEFEEKKSGEGLATELANDLNLLVKTDPDNEAAYDGLLSHLLDALKENADGTLTSESKAIVKNAINPNSLTLDQCRADYERLNRGSVSDSHLDSILRAFDEFILTCGGDTDVSDIDRRVVSKWVEDYVQTLKIASGKYASLETRKKRVKYLSVVFNDLLMRGHIETNPFSGMSVLVKANESDVLKESKRPWTKDEIDKLLRLKGKYVRLHPVIKILGLSGLRLGELWGVKKVRC